MKKSKSDRSLNSLTNTQVGEEEVIVEPGDQISPSVARAALDKVAEEASRQPMLVRRLARKHQVKSIAIVLSLY